MQFIYAIILGIIEGITEFLPISSTGHLILFGRWLPLEPKEFANAFMIIIQLGAILSVIVLYWNRLNPFKLNLATGQTNLKGRLSDAWDNRDKSILRLWAKVIIAVLPAAVLGFLLDDWIDAKLFSWKVVVAMLIVWGTIIIAIEKKNPTPVWIPKVSNISYKMAFVIGLFQCLAMVPGTSRSAATVMGGILLGVSRTAAAEFSFFLAIPTMLGATLLKLIKLGSGFSFVQWMVILVGFLVSFLVAYLVIKKFMEYIKSHDFIPFGIYRIILGIIILIFSIV
ncbi:MAG: undecaprenyl-diphosphate phosphatase [Tissierellia bacterium]|nr:undecaprenyl-diphosphate phosphatase [Tissierellia bacterium]